MKYYFMLFLALLYSCFTINQTSHNVVNDTYNYEFTNNDNIEKKDITPENWRHIDWGNAFLNINDSSMFSSDENSVIFKNTHRSSAFFAGNNQWNIRHSRYNYNLSGALNLSNDYTYVLNKNQRKTFYNTLFSNDEPKDVPTFEKYVSISGDDTFDVVAGANYFYTDTIDFTFFHNYPLNVNSFLIGFQDIYFNFLEEPDLDWMSVHLDIDFITLENNNFDFTYQREFFPSSEVSDYYRNQFLSFSLPLTLPSIKSFHIVLKTGNPVFSFLQTGHITLSSYIGLEYFNIFHDKSSFTPPYAPSAFGFNYEGCGFGNVPCYLRNATRWVFKGFIGGIINDIAGHDFTHDLGQFFDNLTSTFNLYVENTIGALNINGLDLNTWLVSLVDFAIIVRFLKVFI